MFGVMSGFDETPDIGREGGQLIAAWVFRAGEAACTLPLDRSFLPYVYAESATMVRNPPAGLIAILFATVLAAGSACADQREDFLSGKTRSCPRCDLSGQSFKRRDLANADL